MTSKPILILGAGELGLSILHSLLSHTLFSSSVTPITLLIRATTLNNPTSVSHLTSLPITLLGLDTAATPISELNTLFSGYHTVIHCSAMFSPSGTQSKITNAVIQAGVELYIPWQFGVDYDVIGPDAGDRLFAEQYSIRELLRVQKRTEWTILSCGIFMSFLFDERWGVISKVYDNEKERLGTGEGSVRVRALGSWDDAVTVTTIEDIGKCTAEIVLDEKVIRNGVAFIAGETLTYGQLADAVEDEMGMEVVRDVWERGFLAEVMRKEPENKLAKYHVVFGGGKGVSWEKEQSWNETKGMKVEGVRSWVRRNWK